MAGLAFYRSKLHHNVSARMKFSLLILFKINFAQQIKSPNLCLHDSNVPEQLKAIRRSMLVYMLHWHTALLRCAFVDRMDWEWAMRWENCSHSNIRAIHFIVRPISRVVRAEEMSNIVKTETNRNSSKHRINCTIAVSRMYPCIKYLRIFCALTWPSGCIWQ